MSNKVIKPRYDFGISGGLVAFTAYQWAATIVQEGGAKSRPSDSAGCWAW